MQMIGSRIVCTVPAKAGTHSSASPTSEMKLRIEIDPMRVVALDHRDLPVALPFLDLSLALARPGQRFVDFIPNQPIDSVRLREPRHHLVLMFPCATQEVGRAAAIQRPIGIARKQIDRSHRAFSTMGPGLRRDGIDYLSRGWRARNIAAVPAKAGTHPSAFPTNPREDGSAWLAREQIDGGHRTCITMDPGFRRDGDLVFS